MAVQTYLPGPTPDTVRTPAGRTLPVPVGWVLLPPGDAGLTRRVKAAGEFWLVQEKVGRRVFSRGLWAPRETIEQVREGLAAERSTEAYSRRREADSRRREAEQAEYVEDFGAAVIAFLAFHGRHAELAQRLAKAVAEHATPVGSGTVARTKRIPIERRAEAAVIAWMRHQTTSYDSMTIARVKGQRREVRRMLAQRSKELLGAYRRGESIAPSCPLAQALSRAMHRSAGHEFLPESLRRLLDADRPPQGSATQNVQEKPRGAGEEGEHESHGSEQPG
jgi:hypothetical protein